MERHLFQQSFICFLHHFHGCNLRVLPLARFLHLKYNQQTILIVIGILSPVTDIVIIPFGVNYGIICVEISRIRSPPPLYRVFAHSLQPIKQEGNGPTSSDFTNAINNHEIVSFGSWVFTTLVGIFSMTIDIVSNISLIGIFKT